MRVLIIGEDLSEDTELLVPLYRLEEAGIAADVASASRGAMKGRHAYKVNAARSVDEVHWDGLSTAMLM